MAEYKSKTLQQAIDYQNYLKKIQLNTHYGKASKVFYMKARYTPGIKKLWGLNRPAEDTNAVADATYQITYDFASVYPRSTKPLKD